MATAFGVGVVVADAALEQLQAQGKVLRGSFGVVRQGQEAAAGVPAPLALAHHEWVADDYGHRSKLGVLRGGGWNTHLEENLYSGARNTAPPTFHDNIYGFRVMLARVPRADPDNENNVEPQPETGPNNG